MHTLVFDGQEVLSAKYLNHCPILSDTILVDGVEYTIAKIVHEVKDAGEWEDEGEASVVYYLAKEE